jgi:hypothetical protein
MSNFIKYSQIITYKKPREDMSSWLKLPTEIVSYLCLKVPLPLYVSAQQQVPSFKVPLWLAECYIKLNLRGQRLVS